MINAYVDSVRPVTAHLVEEVAREFQLDEIAPVASNEGACVRRCGKSGSTQALCLRSAG